MAEKYVVYVAEPSEAPSVDKRRRLADLLSLDVHKVDSLLRRLPADITKPVPEATALTVARRVREAGLEAFVRPHAPGREATIESVAARSPSPPSSPTRRLRDRSDQDDIWKTEFRSGASRRDEEEDQLFPPSAFTNPQGPKAPSKPLVIALFAVLLVLAALWFLF